MLFTTCFPILCQHNLPKWLAVLLLLIAAPLSAGEVSVQLEPQYIDKLGDRYGPDAKNRLQAWQNLIRDISHLPEQEQLRAVNDFFNQVRFLNDIDHWQKKDYWATPVEFLVSNGGDCEDFSIAKYYTLKEVGIDTNKLSIAYVKALKLNQAHMVLTYYPSPNAEPLVLDNLITDIKPASLRIDLLYVYSFNGDSLWVSKRGQRTKRAGTSDRLAPWVQLQSRLEGQRVNVK